MDLVAPHSCPRHEWPLSSGFPGMHDTVRHSWSGRKHGVHTHSSDPVIGPTRLVGTIHGGLGWGGTCRARLEHVLASLAGLSADTPDVTGVG